MDPIIFTIMSLRSRLHTLIKKFKLHVIMLVYAYITVYKEKYINVLIKLYIYSHYPEMNDS